MGHPEDYRLHGEQLVFRDDEDIVPWMDVCEMDDEQWAEYNRIVEADYPRRLAVAKEKYGDPPCEVLAAFAHLQGFGKSKSTAAFREIDVLRRAGGDAWENAIHRYHEALEEEFECREYCNFANESPHFHLLDKHALPDDIAVRREFSRIESVAIARHRSAFQLAMYNANRPDMLQASGVLCISPDLIHATPQNEQAFATLRKHFDIVYDEESEDCIEYAIPTEEGTEFAMFEPSSKVPDEVAWGRIIMNPSVLNIAGNACIFHNRYSTKTGELLLEDGNLDVIFAAVFLNDDELSQLAIIRENYEQNKEIIECLKYTLNLTQANTSPFAWKINTAIDRATKIWDSRIERELQSLFFEAVDMNMAQSDLLELMRCIFNSSAKASEFIADARKNLHEFRV